MLSTCNRELLKKAPHLNGFSYHHCTCKWEVPLLLDTLLVYLREILQSKGQNQHGSLEVAMPVYVNQTKKAGTEFLPFTFRKGNCILEFVLPLAVSIIKCKHSISWQAGRDRSPALCLGNLLLHTVSKSIPLARAAATCPHNSP